MPKVSVIIPVRNAAKHLGACLDSVRAQTLKAIEIICVDDGSTDGSAAILAEYAAKDQRVKLLATPRAGAGAARNAGLDAAQGEYLYFCDADDWMDRTMLESLHAAASRAGADVAAGGFYYYDDALSRDFQRVDIPREFLTARQPFPPSLAGEKLFSAFRIQLWNKMFRRDFVCKAGLKFQEQPRVNDLAFVETALALAGGIAAVDGAFYHYRKNHGANLSSGLEEMPEMSTLAWLKVKENLMAAGVFDNFKPAFARSASHSLYEVAVSMRSAAAIEKFFQKAKCELLPALGISRDEADEAARPFFDDDSPLPMILDNLARTRRRRDELQAKLHSFKSHPLRSILGSLVRHSFAIPK